MKLIREFWPHIQVAAALGFVAFLLACDQHDNGIPKNPTPAQQARAAQLNAEAIEELTSVVDAFDTFCEMRDDEDAGADAVIEAGESFCLFYKECINDVCQFVDYTGVESDRKRLAESIKQAQKAGERMANEIYRRRDDPDFKIDQSRYDRMREAITFDSLEPTYVDFCIPSGCFWCKWKHYFYLDRQEAFFVHLQPRKTGTLACSFYISGAGRLLATCVVKRFFAYRSATSSHLNFRRHNDCVSSLLRLIHMFRERFERTVRKMKRRNLKRSLGRVQRLEDRRLLAADLSVIDLAPVESFEPEMCQVAEAETQGDIEEQTETLDLDTTEVQDELSTQVEESVDVDVEVEVDPADQLESFVQNLGDPVDGVDGFFGAIDAENPSQTLSFSPSESGLIDIVVASSFGDAETSLEVSNSNGEVVAATTTENLSGFQTLSFEAEAGEAFELNVSSEDGAEGYFQVTVSHGDVPEPVDLHADSVGKDSTPLEFVDGSSELTGELELAGDVDTFRFTPDSSGTVALNLAELNPENSTELEVGITDADGQQLTRGITNETVGVSFNVEAGTEYFIAVSAGEDQTGSFSLGLTLEADVVESEDTEPEVVVNETDDSEPVEIDADDSVVVENSVDVGDDPVDVDDATDLVDVDDVHSVDEVDDVIDEVATDSDTDAEPVDVGTDIESEPDGQIPVEIVDSADALTVDDVVDNIPESFELEVDLVDVADQDDDPVDTIVDEVVNVDLPIDDGFDGDAAVEFEPIDEFVNEELEVCFVDLGDEIDFVDSFFAQFDPASIFSISDRYELRRL